MRFKFLVSVWLGVSTLTLLVPGPANAQTAAAFTLGFDQNSYTATRVSGLQANVLINPVPPSRLFSYGILVQITGSNGAVGIANLVPAVAYDFNGVAGTGALGESATGEGGIKGTSDFFASGLPPLANKIIATLLLKPLPVGSYTLALASFQTLGAGEQLFVNGNLGVSDPVITYGTATLVVADVPADITTAGAARLNKQTGLFTQSVTLTNNNATLTPTGLRLWIDHVPPGVTVTNASGALNGRAFIDFFKPLRPGKSVTLQVVFRAPSQRTVINPTYSVQEITPPPHAGTAMVVATRPHVAQAAVAGAATYFQPVVTLQNGILALEFPTVAGTTYYVEYSTDLTTWQTAQPAVAGTGAKAQWLDNGPPRTDATPGKASTRFYRVYTGAP